MSQKRRNIVDEPHMLVRTASSDLRSGAQLEPHSHDWHQLVYVSKGLMTVHTEQGSWLAPPTWAVWVPMRVRHSLRFVGDSSLRTAYVRPDWRSDLPTNCAALTVSPLLRELVLRAVDIGMLDSRDVIEEALAKLIVAELHQQNVPPFNLPQPKSDALLRAVALISTNSAESGNIIALARAVGMSARTFERAFASETGMTPGRWRQQQLLLRGLEQLAAGMSIKVVAASCAYATTSAFIAAFRKSFGTTPGRYFSLE